MRALHNLNERLAWHIVGGLRILLTNGPRSYRETIAAALQALRPETEVRTVEPEMLSRELEDFAPQLVICSSITSAMKTGVLSWVELYPGHESISAVSIGREHSVINGIELPDLLSIVDRTEILAKSD